MLLTKKTAHLLTVWRVINKAAKSSPQSEHMFSSPPSRFVWIFVFKRTKNENKTKKKYRINKMKWKRNEIFFFLIFSIRFILVEVGWWLKTTMLSLFDLPQLLLPCRSISIPIWSACNRLSDVLVHFQVDYLVTHFPAFSISTVIGLLMKTLL